jgi:hypothetical protein
MNLFLLVAAGAAAAPPLLPLPTAAAAARSAAALADTSGCSHGLQRATITTNSGVSTQPHRNG